MGKKDTELILLQEKNITALEKKLKAYKIFNVLLLIVLVINILLEVF